MINVILACAGMALAGPASSGPGHVGAGVAAAPAAAVAAATMGAAGESDLAPSFARACVQALSKNICDSELASVAPQIDGCHGDCRTLFVPDATWRLPMRSNRQNCLPCSGPGQCDEVPEKDGSLEAYIRYTLRLNGPCPSRGCFEGRWVHRTEDGLVYSGRVTGTMGAGTHRFNQWCCESSADRTCERCLDVEFIPSADQTTGTWRIGVEATFEGWLEGSGEPIPDKMHFSLSGDFYAPGDTSGPYIFDGYSWRFSGTADGVHNDYCN